MPWTYIIVDLNREKLFGRFSEKELQKTNKQKRLIKVIKKKDDKLHVKCNGYDNSIDSCIH